MSQLLKTTLCTSILRLLYFYFYAFFLRATHAVKSSEILNSGTDAMGFRYCCIFLSSTCNFLYEESFRLFCRQHNVTLRLVLTFVRLSVTKRTNVVFF